MIFAKCIRESQIAHSKEEFESRKDETNSVYCEGETTVARNADTLYCVPLNIIYDCLKYGMYIAIIDMQNDEKSYPYGCPVKLMIGSSEQKVLKILPADSIETVKFVVSNVGNKEVLRFGYKNFLSDDVKRYIKDTIM